MEFDNCTTIAPEIYETIYALLSSIIEHQMTLSYAEGCF